MNTTTTMVRPFGLAVAAPTIQARLAELMAQYGYDEVYPITAADGDDDTAVVLRADRDHRLYLLPSDGYINAEGLRWPVQFDTVVMRPHEITEDGLFLGLVATLGAVAAQLDVWPGEVVARDTCARCGMQFDPKAGCAWCAKAAPLLPKPSSPEWKTEREAMRAATANSRRECVRCDHNAGADPEWHGLRFGHAPVVAGGSGRLLEFDGERFARSVALGADGSTVPADS